ncbi:hypothetical protein N658DRAFT_514997 [Parathielavia hyrcaniae]|uniref:Zinc-finger domain-containing protein n=1 Tax=Parathielavia hyrcaniae TaxID=113614 RepID=A0AAN6Q8J7_9PEZI|nr:hypothetical protein N658DRAFT_514997 [Parathielavia hyrcaniae]
MSQYPYTYGYGQFYGQPTPQAHAYSSSSGYEATGQNPPYNSFASQTNRDASQAAYDSNVINIPGLGIGAPAAPGTHPNLAFNTAAWAQPPSFPGPVPNIPPPQTHGVNDFDPRRSQADVSSASRNGAQVSSQAAPAAKRSAPDVEIEEGELSEGQFEDLYEPREYAAEGPKQAAIKPRPLSIAGTSQPASAADTPDGGFYGTDEDDCGRELRGNEGRERSASYSPFLSPREIRSEIPTPQPTSEPKVGKRVRSAPSQPVVKTVNSSGTGPQSPNRAVADPASTDSAHLAGSKSQPQKDDLSSFRPLQEARKEAQKAILRLWPLGVKYQNYIEEGFDKNLISGLFRDLHLDMPKIDVDSSVFQTKGAPHRGTGEPESTKPKQSSDLQSIQTTTVTADLTTMADQSQKGEERKDRIARLLAAKAAKAPALPKPPAPAPSTHEQVVPKEQPQETAVPQPAPLPPKSKTWGEKERLIQQKIAALQKAREAQKSATDPAGSEGMQAEGNGTSPSQITATGSPAPLSVPPGPIATSLSQTTANNQHTPAQSRPLPASSAPSPNAQLNAANQRKRPVAADFVEFSSGPSPPKRPFGQIRKETSFIIDVSDESDDGEMDMDMDMDMGSPVDETRPIQSIGTPNQRGRAVRDFPPLTDTLTQRRVSSPAPSVTPPGGLVDNKRREMELSLKEKAIQDMRRKIALAEARRKAKQSSGGSLTPKQPASSSHLSENGASRILPTESTESMSSPDRSERTTPQFTPEPSSTRLSRRSESLHLDPLQRAERRGRLMSLEIPRVKSSLTEKWTRLQQLQDEQARLKAEIDTGLAEERRLAEELLQLETARPMESPPLNEPDLGNGFGSSSSSSSSQAAEAAGDQQQAEGCVLQIGNVSVETQTHVSPSAPSPSVPNGRQGTGDARRTEDESLQEQILRESSPPKANGVGVSFAVPEIDKPNDSAGPLPNASKSIEQSSPGDGAISQGQRTAAVSSPTSQPPEHNTPGSSRLEETDRADETTPMELDSRSPSPNVMEPLSSIGTPASAPLPDQISNVAQPREAVQEIEAETTGQVNVVSSRSPGTWRLTKSQVRGEPASMPSSTLVPFESPLRYFHAYRFHPEYQRAVAGGLKSLTYSNRIDPEKELCPFELCGEQCPVNCEFQHFGSISPPDDQILLELGNPDDYSGEQKSRFIQGLRELLQKFKAEKVKDFNTIARGIIEFRSQLLGDKSKVLRLDGVTI